jgi:hypothetical protein
LHVAQPVETSPFLALLAPLRGRWSAPLALGFTVVILGFGLWETAVALDRASAVGQVGGDLAMYLQATQRFLGGGSFYLPQHVAAPYVLSGDAILYPPTTIPLFVAFLVLPSALFWLVPIVVIGWVVAQHRPTPWAWPLLAECLVYTPTVVKVVHGNPVMWVAAAVALGTLHRWPAVFVLLKPSLAPFALLGAGHRSWWAALGASVVSGLLLAPLWIDYLSVLLNARGPLASPLYSVGDIPLLLVPVIAWIASERRFGRVPTKLIPVTA